MHALHGVDGALGRVKSVYMFSRVAKRQRGSKAQFHGRQNFIKRPADRSVEPSRSRMFSLARFQQDRRERRSVVNFT